MNTSESITFIGIILTFITTIIGWIVTSKRQNSILDKQIKSQKDLAFLTEKLSLNREQKLLLISGIFDFLNDLSEWFELGRKIYLNSVTISNNEVKKLRSTKSDELNNDIQELENKVDQFKDELDQIDKIHQELHKLRTRAPKLLYLAKIHDPEFLDANQWNWGQEEMPKDLPQIIDAFEDEIIDKVYEVTGMKREKPFVQEQFHHLHEAGTKAIFRLQQYYSSQNSLE